MLFEYKLMQFMEVKLKNSKYQRFQKEKMESILLKKDYHMFSLIESINKPNLSFDNYYTKIKFLYDK